MQGHKECEENFDITLRQETIKTLLEYKAKPNIVNSKTKMTCLHWACFYPDDELSVKRLLDAGAHIFALDVQGFSPLDIAGIASVRSGKKTTKVIDFLVEHAEIGVNDTLNAVEELNKKNNIAIDTEDSAKNMAYVKTKLKEYTFLDQYYLDLMYWAAYRNRSKLVERLIKVGISPFVKFFMRESAIVGAIKGGALKTVKLIMSYEYKALGHPEYDVKSKGIFRIIKRK